MWLVVFLWWGKVVPVDLSDLMFGIKALRKSSVAPPADGANWWVAAACVRCCLMSVWSVCLLSSLTQLSALRASTRSPSSADSTSLWSSSMDQPDVSVSLSTSSAWPIVHLLICFKLSLKHLNQLIFSCDLQLLMKVVSGKWEWTFLINTPSNRHQ